jgi:hypothetical protein
LGTRVGARVGLGLGAVVWLSWGLSFGRCGVDGIDPVWVFDPKVGGLCDPNGWTRVLFLRVYSNNVRRLHAACIYICVRVLITMVFSLIV